MLMLLHFSYARIHLGRTCLTAIFVRGKRNRKQEHSNDNSISSHRSDDFEIALRPSQLRYLLTSTEYTCRQIIVGYAAYKYNCTNDQN